MWKQAWDDDLLSAVLGCARIACKAVRPVDSTLVNSTVSPNRNSFVLQGGGQFLMLSLEYAEPLNKMVGLLRRLPAYDISLPGHEAFEPHQDVPPPAPADGLPMPLVTDALPRGICPG